MGSNQPMKKISTGFKAVAALQDKFPGSLAGYEDCAHCMYMDDGSIPSQRLLKVHHATEVTSL